MVTSGYMSRLWTRDSQPQFWSKFQVWEWLQQLMDIHQIDTSTIPFQNFDIDGHQLCSLSYEDFIHAAGSVGPILFHSITELKWSGASQGVIGALKGGGWLVTIKEIPVESCWGGITDPVRGRTAWGCRGGEKTAWREGDDGCVVFSCPGRSPNKAQRGCEAETQAVASPDF